MPLRERATLLSCMLFTLGATAPASAFGPDPQLLYEVDFNSHTVGETPPTDNGPFPRSAPSDIPFSSPTVADSALGLADQPLLFDCCDEGSIANEQVSFRAGDLGAPIYRVDVDLSIAGATHDGFIDNVATLYLDMPSIFPIRFGEDGHGELFANQFDYAEGVPFHLTAIVDFSEREWQLRIGETFLTGPLDYSGWTDLRSVRFNIDSSPVAALDNLVIWAIPEPSTGALVLLGLLALGVRRR
jgi:PEP-CTERM motif-containing protein